MPRVKGGVISAKRRRNTLRRVKGYHYGRGNKERQAKEAIMHAGTHAFDHRRKRKNDFRRLWITQINAGLGRHGISYSTFIPALKNAGIGLDRKILAELAEHHPEAFDAVVKKANG